jgi:hypothetical protein
VAQVTMRWAFLQRELEALALASPLLKARVR